MRNVFASDKVHAVSTWFSLYRVFLEILMFLEVVLLILVEIMIGDLFQEYDLFDRILNNFQAIIYNFLLCENYLEVCNKPLSLLGQTTIVVIFSGQLSSQNCNSPNGSMGRHGGVKK